MAQADRLISRQVRRWEVDQRLREPFARDEAAAHGRGDVVTISRERGSGGTLIGRMVAEQRNWDFYDRELIDSVAEHMGTEPEAVEAHDERAPNLMHELLRQLLEGNRPTEAQYLRSLVRILRVIRARGHAVIMGRGAHLVLPDALRVRIVAPVDIRVERLAELEDISLAEARREVLSSDRDRDQFIRGHFGVGAGDPYYYDLILNTATMSLEHAAHLVICAAEARGAAAEG
jgi:cytidylate kinase